MNRILRLAVAGAAVAAFVAACSSDSDSGTAAGTSAPAATSAAATSAPATSAPATSAAATSAPATSAGGAPAAGSGTITVRDFKYGEPLTVAPGATITVVNEDTAGHDVVSDDEGRFKTPVLGKGERATFAAPMEPGTYKFSCSVHPGSMTGIGTLVVQG
jgi:plastocyanin